MKSFRLLPALALQLLVLSPVRAQTPPDTGSGVFDGVPDDEKPAVDSLRERMAQLDKAHDALLKAAAENAKLSVSNVDLSAQWKDDSRNQSFIGSCHVYAAVGIVEAALFRATGDRVHINEQDLYLQSKVLNNAKPVDSAFKPYCESGTCSLLEGGYSDQDASYLFDHGAALVTDENPQLREDFVDAWGDYEGSVSGILEAYNAKIDDAIKKGSMDASNASVCASRDKCALDQGHGPQVDAMLDAIRKQADVKTALDLKKMRADVRSRLSGLRLFHKTFSNVLDNLFVAKATKGACLDSDAGKSILSTIETELYSGHPLAVGMQLQGLKPWGQDKVEGLALHAFVITGLDHNAAGDVILKTRNSWGSAEIAAAGRPNNPWITLDELCRIQDAYVVLTAKEPAPSSPGFVLEKTAD